jgi:hypothetical protein
MRKRVALWLLSALMLVVPEHHKCPAEHHK